MSSLQWPLVLLLLREHFKPGQRSLVISSLQWPLVLLLLREHFKPGQRSHEKFPPVLEICSNIWDDFKPV